VFHSGVRTPVILLVEDDGDDEILTVRALRRAGVANDIVVARDGVEALDYLFGTGIHADRDPSDRPQVVLLDLRLPRLDGLEVLQRVRADARTERLPVVILTTSPDDSERIDGHEVGASHCVPKPVDFHRLVEAARALGLSWLVVDAPAVETP
jgi:DNA-binding response OmpR family regulator